MKNGFRAVNQKNGRFALRAYSTFYPALANVAENSYILLQHLNLLKLSNEQNAFMLLFGQDKVS